jgi:hypothetical protein
MKTYKIPVVWQMMGTVEVQAESLDDAVGKVLDTSVPLPEDGEYIEGSFEVDESVYSLQEDESLSDYYTVGSHVNVTFNTNDRFSGVIKGHNCGFIVVEDEDGATWEVEPHMVSFRSDVNMTH